MGALQVRESFLNRFPASRDICVVGFTEQLQSLVKENPGCNSRKLLDKISHLFDTVAATYGLLVIDSYQTLVSNICSFTGNDETSSFVERYLHRMFDQLKGKGCTIIFIGQATQKGDYFRGQNYVIH